MKTRDSSTYDYRPFSAGCGHPTLRGALELEAQEFNARARGLGLAESFPLLRLRPL